VLIPLRNAVLLNVCGICENSPLYLGSTEERSDVIFDESQTTDSMNLNGITATGICPNPWRDTSIFTAPCDAGLEPAITSVAARDARRR
jgi:hypothetical protein